MNSELPIVPETQIPCIIDQGIIFSKRDMFRVLQSLDHVNYYEIVDGKVLFEREGFLVEIFEDPKEATIFFNRRIYLNLSSFEYLKINSNFLSSFKDQSPEIKNPNKPDYRINLFMTNEREVVLVPINDPISSKESLFLEVEERKRITSMTQEEEWTATNSRESQEED